MRIRRGNLPSARTHPRRGIAHCLCRKPAPCVGALFLGDRRCPDPSTPHTVRPDVSPLSGDPLEVLLFYPNGTGEITIIGPDLVAGMRPQVLIPGGTFHTSRLQTLHVRTGFALLGTTEWPGFESADLELADPTKLIAAYPTLRREIEAFTRTQGADSS